MEIPKSVLIELADKWYDKSDNSMSDNKADAYAECANDLTDVVNNIQPWTSEAPKGREMKKQLIEYQWFQRYSDYQIGLDALGRKFYPTKRRVVSCRNCQFLRGNWGEPKYCDLGIDLEDGINRPMTRCFPCKSRKYAGRGDIEQGEALMLKIYELCEKEERQEETK